MSLVSQITSLASRVAAEFKTVRTEIAASAGGIKVSDTAPANPTTGMEWMDSTTGQTFVWYDGFWVEKDAVGVNGPTGPAGPTGATGASGSSGVVSVNAPLTNTGTSTSAVLGIQSSPTFTGNGTNYLVDFKKSNGVTRAYLTPNGSDLHVGSNTAESGSVQIGSGATGNQYAYVDLIGDTTYTDYGARLIRENQGPNTNTALIHRGTGSLVLSVAEAGAIRMQTSGADRIVVDSNGYTSFGGTIQTKGNTGGVYLNSNDTGGLSVRGSAGNAASMSFHIPGQYAINMGLDTDNGFKIGGWSAGADALVVQQNRNVRLPSQPAIVLDGNYSAWEVNTAYTTVKRMSPRADARGGFSWNAANGRLTVPVTGWYAMSYITYQQANTTQRLHLRRNDASFAMRHFYQSGGDGQSMIYGLVYANANDYFDVFLEAAVNSYYGPNHSFATVNFLG